MTYLTYLPTCVIGFAICGLTYRLCFQDGGDDLGIKVIVQKGTKPWSKINSNVNNMYFTLKSPRYVALSFRHGGWRRKRTEAVGENLRSRFCSRFCTLLCQNREGRQEFAALKIKRLLVMLFEFSFADFAIFSRISEYCKYVCRLVVVLDFRILVLIAYRGCICESIETNWVVGTIFLLKSTIQACK